MLDRNRWRPPIPIAHRGSRLLWPENTLEAFAAAVDLGYQALETDLHITADGVLVCIHDDTVDRTTEATGDVRDYTYAELADLDAGYRHLGPDGHSYRGQGIKVPRLEELATSFPDASLILDLKTEGMAEALATLIDELHLTERIIVGSFVDERIAEFREASAGRVPTSTGSTSSRTWVLTSRVRRGAGGDASALQVPRLIRGVRVVDDRLVETAHDHGLQVHVWTVNEADEMEQMLEIGVDGLVTDRPDILKGVLARRGAWPS